MKNKGGKCCALALILALIIVATLFFLIGPNTLTSSATVDVKESNYAIPIIIIAMVLIVGLIIIFIKKKAC